MSALTHPPEVSLDAPRPTPTDQLLPALFRAVSAIEAPRKTAFNPGYKSKFANLEAVMDAVREPLASNGLLLLQLLEPEPGGGQFLVTRLVHTSGQYIESRARLLMAKQDAQGMGSAITYMRRYTVQCMLGIVPEDDDGAAASHPPQHTVPAAAKAPAAAATPPASLPAALPSVATGNGPIERLKVQLQMAKTIASVDAVTARLPPMTLDQRATYTQMAQTRKQQINSTRKDPTR